MSFAGTLMTPRIDAKIRRKLYKNNKKSDFKDILRERFKSRIKDSRRILFDKIRSSGNSDTDSTIQNTLTDLLRTEMSEFEGLELKSKSKDNWNEQPVLDHELGLELMKELETELLSEQYDWILEEYRKEEEEINSMMTDSTSCPLCECGILQQDNSSQGPVNCTFCDLHLITTFDQLSASLHHNIEEHSRLCTSKPQFSVVNYGLNTLLMMCDKCSLFITLT